ncbi:MAG: hypothetical protein ACTHU0_27130 [Kofleriaceae bacterium]
MRLVAIQSSGGVLFRQLGGRLKVGIVWIIATNERSAEDHASTVAVCDERKPKAAALSASWNTPSNLDELTAVSRGPHGNYRRSKLARASVNGIEVSAEGTAQRTHVSRVVFLAESVANSCDIISCCLGHDPRDLMDLKWHAA